MVKVIWLDKSNRSSCLKKHLPEGDFLNLDINDLSNFNFIAIHFTDLTLDGSYNYSTEDENKVLRLKQYIIDNFNHIKVLVYSGKTNSPENNNDIKYHINEIFNPTRDDVFFIECGISQTDEDASFIKNYFLYSSKDELNKEISKKQSEKDKQLAIELVSQVVNFLHIENLDSSSPSYQWWRKLNDTFSDSGDSLVDALAEQIVKNEDKIDELAAQTLKNEIKINVKQRHEESRQNDLTRWKKAGLIHLSEDGETR